MRKCADVPAEACPNHGADYCCTACTANGTDGAGFPLVHGGRRPLRQCPHCQQWTPAKLWMHDTLHAVFCCVVCMGAAYERIAAHLESLLPLATTAPRRVKLRVAIDEVRKRARSLRRE